MSKVRVQETVLPQHKGYKGQIRWVKLKIGENVFKVEKRRSFGWQSYSITENEYNWIDTAKKAEKMWGFIHFHGTAAWFGGEVSHPMTGAVYQNEDANAERPAA